MRKVLACLVALSLSRALFAAPPARFVEALKAGKAQTIVCYGTSLTAQSHYWVDDLRSALAARWPGQATVVNAGQSGKNAAFGLANVRTQVVARKPDAVLIEFSPTVSRASRRSSSGRRPPGRCSGRRTRRRMSRRSAWPPPSRWCWSATTRISATSSRRFGRPMDGRALTSADSATTDGRRLRSTISFTRLRRAATRGGSCPF